MAKAKLNKEELRKMVEFNRKHENFLLMPNEVIEMLVKDEELTDGTAIAVAYSYIFLITWLYRYTKYGALSFDTINVKGIKTMLGLSPTNNTYDYIIKKGGILDRLKITETHNFNEAPITVWVDKEDNYGYPEFTYFKELEDDSKAYSLNGQTTKKKTIKEPLLATGMRKPLGEEEEEYNGTFFEGGKEFTHMIPFEAFLECITNPKLGCEAFYLYSFVQCRMGGGEVVSISQEGIMKNSGFKSTSLNKYMKELKAFGLIGGIPEDFCLERGTLHTDSSTYWTNDISQWKYTPDYNFKTRNVYHVTSHIDYVGTSVETIEKKA